MNTHHLLAFGDGGREGKFALYRIPRPLMAGHVHTAPGQPLGAPFSIVFGNASLPLGRASSAQL